MPNKTYALEWMQFAWKNLKTAELLYNAMHYEDIIGVELQQSIEKSLKSIFAYDGERIPKEHDLVKIYFLLEKKLELSEHEIIFLRIATNYYKDDRYPNPNYYAPPREEISKILNFTQELFGRICFVINVQMDEIYA